MKYDNLPAEYGNVTLNLKDSAAACKILGRSYRNDNGLVMLWPANAVEFTATLEGELILHYTAEENGYLQVFIDGKADRRIRLTASETEAKLVLANVQAGTHTVRIVRENDIDSNGKLTVWHSLTFRGIADSVCATKSKAKYIEFVGDSITSGKGVMSGERYQRDDPNHSSTHSHAYLAAEMLDADYSLVSRGSCGYIRESASCPKTMMKMYDYVNPLCADEDLKAYDFSRKPDLIVLSLGTNDHVLGEEFDNAAKTMIAQLRERNGADVPLVMMYGMMTPRHNEDIPLIAESVGAYSLKVTQDNSGGRFREVGTNHPGIEGQKKIAEELTAFLKTIL
ncbi:MAG: hypothetical protein IJ980_06350 [Oscillospiraceae bacterium]|nr:hypothetical protein [Oscillospiraceae bacterium]